MKECKVYKNCKNCRKEKKLLSDYYMNRSKFYFSKQGRLDICKDCLLKEFEELCKEFKQQEVVKYLCQKLDYYWSEKIYNTCKNKEGNIMGIYISRINSLRQYESLTYNDIEVENEDKDKRTFNEQVVNRLKSEAKNIIDKLQKISNSGDYGSYKNLINILKDLAKLINEYDYELKYSVDTVEDGCSEGVVISHKEIAVWEQNFDGRIKNHRKWRIEESVLGGSDK